MTLSRYKTPVVQLDARASVFDAARIMRDRHVGCVIVARENHPLGVVTDRDLVVRILAEGREGVATIEECITYDPITVRVTDSVETAVALMREHGVRRLPLVDDVGQVVGIVTADDLLVRLGSDLGRLCEAIAQNVDANESR
jgi:CBS domain-containing protein